MEVGEGRLKRPERMVCLDEQRDSLKTRLDYKCLEKSIVGAFFLHVLFKRNRLSRILCYKSVVVVAHMRVDSDDILHVLLHLCCIVVFDMVVRV